MDLTIIAKQPAKSIEAKISRRLAVAAHASVQPRMRTVSGAVGRKTFDFRQFFRKFLGMPPWFAVSTGLILVGDAYDEIVRYLDGIGPIFWMRLISLGGKCGLHIVMAAEVRGTLEAPRRPFRSSRTIQDGAGWKSVQLWREETQSRHCEMCF